MKNIKKQQRDPEATISMWCLSFGQIAFNVYEKNIEY